MNIILSPALLFVVSGCFVGCLKSTPVPDAPKEAPSLARERPQLDKTEREKLGGDVKVQVWQSRAVSTPAGVKATPTYKSIRAAGPPGILGSRAMLDVADLFEEWRTEYVYGDSDLRHQGIATGARTFDGDGIIVGEAKLLRRISGEEIEIEEFHLSASGTVKFYCKSRFSVGAPGKRSESEAEGQRDKDYYPVWPTRAN